MAGASHGQVSSQYLPACLALLCRTLHADSPSPIGPFSSHSSGEVSTCSNHSSRKRRVELRKIAEPDPEGGSASPSCVRIEVGTELGPRCRQRIRASIPISLRSLARRRQHGTASVERGR